MERIDVTGGWGAVCVARGRDWSRWRVTLPDSGGAAHTQQVVIWVPPAETGLGLVPVTVCDDTEPMQVRQTWLMPPVGDGSQFAARVGWPGNPQAATVMGRVLSNVFRGLGFDVDDLAVTNLWHQALQARGEWEALARRGTQADRDDADRRYGQALSAYERAVKAAGARQLGERREEPA